MKRALLLAALLVAGCCPLQPANSAASLQHTRDCIARYEAAQTTEERIAVDATCADTGAP